MHAPAGRAFSEATTKQHFMLVHYAIEEWRRKNISRGREERTEVQRAGIKKMISKNHLGSKVNKTTSVGKNDIKIVNFDFMQGSG
jgi:hypothetical protein